VPHPRDERLGRDQAERARGLARGAAQDVGQAESVDQFVRVTDRRAQLVTPAAAGGAGRRGGGDGRSGRARLGWDKAWHWR